MGGQTVGGGDYRNTEKHAGINVNGVVGFLKSPRGTVIRIEVFVVVAALVLLLLAAFGSCRRRRRGWLIQNVVLGAFTLSSSLVTYTIGSMQSSAVKSSMYPIWAMSLYILAGSPDFITAYSLDDNYQTTRLVYKFFLNYAYVGLIIAANATHFSAVLGFLVGIAVLKFGHRTAAYQLASASWNLNKMVADYMYEEHTMTNHEETPWDPVSMKGYRYPVDWPLSQSIAEGLRDQDDTKVIDIEKIWGSSDRTVVSPELKDACLSFSLFHLLRRRFFGFACAESTQQKTHDFVFKGLLLAVAAPAENEERRVDYDRVFKVIEVELAFMYDFFFTKYAALYYGSRMVTILPMVSAILIAVTAYLVADRRVIRTFWYAGPVNTTTADVAITLLILACTACLELLQLLLYWTSIWGRVSFVCQNLRRGSRSRTCAMRFKQLLTKIGVYCTSSKCYWQHELGQYSLLDPVSCFPKRRSSLKELAQKIIFCWLTPDRRLLHKPHHASMVCREAGKPDVGFTAEVKKALVDSLVRTDGKLTNGESSLESNGAGDLLWACARDMRSSGTSSSQDQENQARLILTWHIATSYCEMAALRRPRPNEPADLERDVEVATKLSKYCAYLVVSAPRLLPGHHYDTSCEFDKVAEEAMRHLQHEEDRYQAMNGLTLPAEPTDETTIFPRGVMLGKQLEEEMGDSTRRWKVLADFWAELLLYVSPSDKVKDHIECLAQGGELVTHLWALLSHAGILKREDHHRDVGTWENSVSGQNPVRPPR